MCSYVMTIMQDKIIFRWLISTKSEAFTETERSKILSDCQPRQFPDDETTDGSRNVADSRKILRKLFTVVRRTMKNSTQSKLPLQRS